MSLDFSATLCSLCISANFPNDAGKLSLAGGIRLAAFPLSAGLTTMREN